MDNGPLPGNDPYQLLLQNDAYTGAVAKGLPLEIR